MKIDMKKFLSGNLNYFRNSLLRMFTTNKATLKPPLLLLTIHEEEEIATLFFGKIFTKIKFIVF